MLVIPAIDLKDGKVVRLFQGKYDAETVYPEKPQEIAREFEQAGARLIHVVDLDGAREGHPKNLSLAERIVDSVSVPVEMGGGIRSRRIAEEVLKRGVSRVVIGTRAAEDENFVKELVKSFGPRVVAGVDAASGKIRVTGWTETSAINLDELLKRMTAAGLETIIYTSIQRDGTLAGPDIPGIRRVLAQTDIKVIASGGVSSLGNLEELKKLEPEGLAGVIVGKALYEKKFSLTEAIRKFQD